MAITGNKETELIKQITQYYDNLLLKPILPIKPFYNFIMQEPQNLNITHVGNSQSVDIGRLVSSFNQRITENLLPLTHVLLLDNIFFGIYYYDPINYNPVHVESIKNILIPIYNMRYKLTTNDKFKNYHNEITNQDYWNTSRYFIISELMYNINNNNITIVTLNGGLLEKDSGHLFLCLFLNLIRDIFNEDISINLNASTSTVRKKFYEKIGFDCNKHTNDCNATINNLIINCNTNNKNNFDNIKIMLKIKDIYYNNLIDIKEPLMQVLK